MRFNAKFLPVALILMALAAMVGCSSSDSTTNPSNNDNTADTVTFSDFAGLIEAVAPPAFDQVRKDAAVEGNYSVWTSGGYPLLGKVIGSPGCDEPMSLYRNLDMLDDNLAMIEEALAAGEGDIEGESPEGDPFSGSIEILELTAPVTVPEACQAALQLTSVDLQTLCRFAGSDFGMAVDLGFSQTDSTETVLCWQDEAGEGTNLFYAHRDISTNHVVLRGAFWKDTGDEVAAWIYDISSAGADNEDFVYNMAWYSSIMGDTAGIGCVNGSGNRNESFGLRYHQYRSPWTPGVYDEWGPYQQLFGPSGSDLYADLNVDGFYPDPYADYIDVSAMFVYDDMPHALFDSPFPAE